MLPHTPRFGALKGRPAFPMPYSHVPAPCLRLSNKFSSDALTTRSLALFAQKVKSLPFSTSNVSPITPIHSTNKKTRCPLNVLSTSQTKRASFHSSSRVDFSVQDLPESLIHFKSAEGFMQGFGLAILTATPFYALRHWLVTKRPWFLRGCKVIPITIGLGLVAIAMEQCPHTGRWGFFLTERDESSANHETKPGDSKNRETPSISMISNSFLTQIASGVRKETLQESEGQQTATGQQDTAMSKQDDLVLEGNDPRVLLAERVLDRLLERAIEVGAEGQLRLKSFLCNLPITPPQIPNEDVLQGVETLVEKSKEDASMAQKTQRSRRWFRVQKYPFRIHVRNSNEFNAHAFKNNTIILENGIFRDLAMDEDLIAAVVAHELAHLVQQHIRERQSNASLVQLLTAAGIAVCWPVVSMLGPYITLIAVHGLTRGSELLAQRFVCQEQEYEADVMAMTILGLAGYDPMNMLTFHLLLAQKEESDVFRLDRVVLSGLGPKSSRTVALMPASPSPSESSHFLESVPRPTLEQKKAKRDTTVESDPVLVHNQLIKEYLETPLWARWSSTHPSHTERKIRCARALSDIRCKWRLSEIIMQEKPEKSEKALGKE